MQMIGNFKVLNYLILAYKVVVFGLFLLFNVKYKKGKHINQLTPSLKPKIKNKKLIDE